MAAVWHAIRSSGAESARQAEEFETTRETVDSPWLRRPPTLAIADCASWPPTACAAAGSWPLEPRSSGSARTARGSLPAGTPHASAADQGDQSTCQLESLRRNRRRGHDARARAVHSRNPGRALARSASGVGGQRARRRLYNHAEIDHAALVAIAGRNGAGSASIRPRDQLAALSRRQSRPACASGANCY